jgi:hypothetical protein
MAELLSGDRTDRTKELGQAAIYARSMCEPRI